MKKAFLAGLLFAALLGPAFGETRPFAELWNNFAYYETNLERPGFASVLGHYEGKVGLWVLDTPLQVYGAYYGTTAQTGDYFDNSLNTGVGLRAKPFEGSLPGAHWTVEWVRDLKFFAESLSAGYTKGKASAVNRRNGSRKASTRSNTGRWHSLRLAGSASQ